MYVVLIGRPGVGKSTQAARLWHDLGLCRISTGELLRDAIQDDEAANREVAAAIAGGNFASDELIMQLVSRQLDKPQTHDGYLFDGMPRTVAQAESLDALLSQSNAAISVAVELTAETELLVDRLLERSTTEARSDDNLPAIRQRMEVYRDKTEPILQHYQQRGVLCSIDGQGTRDEVHERIKGCLGI